jgi:hypothetical protein
MKNPTVRVLLTLLAIGALGAAAFEGWRIERTRRGAGEAARHADERLRALQLLVSDLRAHQQAYVAAGQGIAFWTTKVSQELMQFDSDAAAARGLLQGTEAQAAIDETLRAMDNFRKLDARAREYARAGQALLASDLIFADGFETTASALTQLDAARTAEAGRADEEGRVWTRKQAELAGAAVGFAVLIMLLLTPVGRAPAGAAAPAPAILALSGLPPATPADATLISEPVKPAAGPDLSAAADVCAGLARVLESAELTPLLGRAATVLDAAGLIVWVADRSGAELRPALAHGYSSQTLARIGAIARDAHNAVAAAYRTNSVRTVSGDGSANGAIVAPISSPGGCLGVLAAEVRRGGEHSDALKSLALVFASQLSTLVSTVPADPVAQAQG